MYQKSNELNKISVIMPVYNVEKYLRRCLNSLINQTYENIEIICIDDGSKDSSLEILKDFANKDSRIKVISQKNTGVSAARNRGMEIATGDFISFIDSDDSVELSFLEKLYNAAITTNSDIAVAPIIRKKQSSEKFRINYQDVKTYTSLQDKLDICHIPDCSYVWNKLYKADLAKQFKFKEGCYFEDIQWIPEVIKNANSVVTVNQTYYTYYKNPNSIVERCPSIKKQDDCYNAKKYIIEFFAENDLKLSEKEKNISKRVKFFCKIPLYKIKEYNGVDTVYLFNFLPIFKSPSQKTFLVFNTACFGDVLACNSLVQNIKLAYSNSKVVFVCDKPFYDVAKYQKDVDDVIVFDKRGEHKGLQGIWKFIKSFPYKKPYASFITYANTKNYIIAHLLGCRRVVQGGYSFFKSTLSSQEQHTNLLKSITKNKVKNMPIEYIATDDIPENLRDVINIDENYIGFCPLTKNPPKDIPLETAIETIKKFNESNKYKIVLFGVGKEYEKYAEDLAKAGCDFVNLVNKTSIYELAQVLKNCKALISADTGTMHLGYALKIPTLAVFYEKNTLANWAPDPNLYNTITLASNQTPGNIYSATLSLLGEENESKVTVVIPTLQKNTELLTNLITTLEQDQMVDEILLIDNSCKGFDYNSAKVRVIIPPHNIYVNPSWNLGVKEARNEIVALLNDDITISPNFCSQVAKKMTRKMGTIGACYRNVKETKNIKNDISDSEIELTPINLISHYWGIAIFFYKSSYIDIPDEIKIFRGDDWIFYQNKSIGRQNYYIEGQDIYHYGSLTSRSKKLKPIGKRDRHFYRKYTKRWYQQYFDKEELYDGYRLNIFGYKTIIKTKKTV